MADKTFLGVEIYRHSSDLSSHDRAWCAANATLRYEGTNQSFSDTGLTAGTTYYYKMVAKYDVDGSIYYSSGVTASQTTAVAPPTVVSAATNTAGTVITITFSKAMANPVGKQAQFSAIIAGSSRSISAAALNADTTKIDLTISGSAIASGQTVTISYTAGDVSASDGSPLGSFSGQSVTNNVVSAYQQWANGQPQSPDFTSVYPYQYLYTRSSGSTYVFLSKSKIYITGNIMYCWGAESIRYYYRSTGAWSSANESGVGTGISLQGDIISNSRQCNNDIYASSALTTIYLAKTTP